MKSYFSLIKFSHTIFALPFALLGFFLAVNTPGKDFSMRILGLVLLCMVFARSAAMAFNRYLDRDIDVKNPRTSNREIPAGKISSNAALLFVVINATLFVLAAWLINPLCFYLSPVALLIILGYSYTKRFTPFCHFVLGLGLSLAPLGAYIAVTGNFALVPILYALAVLLWVAGFDIIYALQDEEFDKSQNLRSLPVALGKKNALFLSSALHLACALIIYLTAWLISRQFEGLGWLNWTAAMLFTGLLFYQHKLVKPHDLSKVNLAFFTTNGVASLIFGGLLILDFYV